MPKKKAKAHLPALNPKRLDLLEKMMRMDAAIPPIAAEAIMQSLRVAANPNAERVDVVIASLDETEKPLVVNAIPGYARILGDVGNRGRNALLMDTELDAMIASQGDDE